MSRVNLELIGKINEKSFNVLNDYISSREIKAFGYDSNQDQAYLYPDWFGIYRDAEGRGILYLTFKNVTYFEFGGIFVGTWRYNFLSYVTVENSMVIINVRLSFTEAEEVNWE